MIIAPGLRGAPRGLTLAFVTSASAGGSTIIIPSAAQVGDIAVLFDLAVQSVGIAGAVVPSGWTQLADGTTGGGVSAGARAKTSYRVLTAGQPGATITGMNGNNYNGKLMGVWRPSRALASVTPGSWSSSMSSSNTSARTVSASAATAPVLVLGCGGARDITLASFDTASPAFDATFLSSSNDEIIGYKVYGSGTPADHTINLGDLGDFNTIQAGYLAIAAA